MASNGPPPGPGPLVTPTHLGPKVDITVWICFVISGLAVTAKVLTKLGRSTQRIRLGALEIDDYILLASWAFAAGQSVSVSRQVDAGLGDPVSVLPGNRIAGFEKAGYAGQLLYILTLGTAKIAGCLFALNLQPHSRNKRIIHGLIVLNVVWAVTSFFAVAFQCSIPRPFSITSDKCLNQSALWTFVEAMNGLTDLVLCIILCSIVWILQISKSKAMLLSVFAARILIIIPIAFRVFYIYEANSGRGSLDWDPTLKETDVAIATTLLMNSSLVMTCIPFLKPLMDNLQPGWSTSDVVRGVGYNMMYGKNTTIRSGQYPMGSVVSNQVRSNGSDAANGKGIKRTETFDIESRNTDRGSARGKEVV